MELIANAQRALARNWPLILVYIVLCAVAAGAYRYLVNELGALVPPDTDPKPAWFNAVSLALDIALAGVASALQAIVFARLGADIDRPLWKCATDGEALRRFFNIWFIINLLGFALVQIQVVLAMRGMPAAFVATDLLYVILSIAYVPVGICLMHNGGLKQLELPVALAPLGRLFPQAMLAGAFGFLQYLLADLMVRGLAEPLRDAPWARALINVPLLALECIAVAMVWIICVQYRDLAAEEHDDDFDF